LADHVKEAMFALHLHDPRTYTPRVLASKFSLSLERTYAILRLKAYELDWIRSGGLKQQTKGENMMSDFDFTGALSIHDPPERRTMYKNTPRLILSDEESSRLQEHEKQQLKKWMDGVQRADHEEKEKFGRYGPVGFVRESQPLPTVSVNDTGSSTPVRGRHDILLIDMKNREHRKARAKRRDYIVSVRDRNGALRTLTEREFDAVARFYTPNPRSRFRFRYDPKLQPMYVEQLRKRREEWKRDSGDFISNFPSPSPSSSSSSLASEVAALASSLSASAKKSAAATAAAATTAAIGEVGGGKSAGAR